MKKLLTGMALTAGLLVGSLGSSRADTSQRGPGGRPPRPPQEALNACESLSDGAACSFSHDGRSISGTCHGPQGKPLACVPKDFPPPPPPEAIDACAKLDAEAACSFTIDGDTITGVCRAPQGKPLACAPQDMPMPR